MFAGVLVLAAIAGGALRAQEVPPPASGPMGDVFENNSNSPVYENQFSESCDSANHSSPYVDGYNAALCFKSPLPPGYTECYPLGGGESFLAGKSGNFCVYCQQPPEGMTGPAIVIPISGGGAVTAPNNYNYTCTANPADPECYLSCFGKFQYTPPPGTVQMGQDGAPPSVPPTPTPGPTPMLKGYISNTEPDPCYPAGPKNYNACDYPNVTRPPGCECSKTPGPQSGKQPTPQPAAQPTSKPAPQSTSQTPDEGNYLQGLVAGIGSCLQNLQGGLVNLATGAGYFAQGNFVQAAQAWGLQPGESMVLQGLYKDMTTPQVGVVNKVSDYQRGLAGGQRLCKYVLIPAATKAIGSAIKGGSGSPSGTPPRAGGTSPTGSRSAPP
ncbi:MAG: hypothetical protein WBE03_09380, partial [Terracidiphilus sp.]